MKQLKTEPNKTESQAGTDYRLSGIDAIKCKLLNKATIRFSSDEIERLIEIKLEWPGEIRQLERSILLAIIDKNITSNDKTITAAEVKRFALKYSEELGYVRNFGR